VPNVCKVAPAVSHVHIEDVHRAGGIMSILGELDRGGLIHRELPTVHSATMGDAIDQWDVTRANDPKIHHFFKAAPGGVPTQVAFSQDQRFDSLDLDARRASSATSSMPSARTAASPCSTATSRSKAAS
jgi:dihydroxy-acid dehydratase